MTNGKPNLDGLALTRPHNDGWIEGADVAIEHLLMSAGWTYHPTPVAVDTAEPAIVLVYGAARHQAFSTALSICRDHDWLQAVRELDGSLMVPVRRVVGLLRRLEALSASPEKVVVRSVDLLAGQIRGIREALPSGVSLETTH